MPTPVSNTPQSPHPAIKSLAPGDRRVLNENELAQRWGVSPKTLQRWRSEGPRPTASPAPTPAASVSGKPAWAQ